MKKIVIALAVMATVLTSASCVSSKFGSKDHQHLSSVKIGGKKVKYQMGHNYFFRNDTEIPQESFITSQADFERLFSPAATMGKNGTPTKIDFSKQMVIGVALPATNDYKEIEPIALTCQGSELTLSYRVKLGQRGMSYTMRPMLLLVIDKIEGVGHCELREM